MRLANEAVPITAQNELLKAIGKNIRSRLTTREESMDRATSLLRQAPFDQPTVLMLCLVLEDAWLSVRPDFADRNGENAGRMNVADGILALARAGQRDPQVLGFYAISRALSLLGPAAAATKNASERRTEIPIPLSLGG